MLVSAEIKLRSLEDTDLDFLFSLENDKSIWAVSGTAEPFSLADLANYISHAKQDIAIAEQFRIVIDWKGKAIGCKVNLRNNNLYIFLEKLLYVILPQIIETKTKKLRVNKTSMNIGIEDISIFTELENQYDLLKNTQGLTISLDLINKTKNAQIPFYFFSSLKIPIIFKYTK